MVQPSDSIRGQIRGSTLLLAGNCLALIVNFVTQLLIARHLAKSSYGMWAYALSVVALGGGFARLGVVESCSRFIAIHHEHKDYARLLGTIALGFAMLLIGGVLFVAVVHAWPAIVLNFIRDPNNARDIILILVFMVPFDAADTLVMAVFASFEEPRAIFVRRYVLAPGLKLLVAVCLLWRPDRLHFLAWGYLLSSVLGMTLYATILVRRAIRDQWLQKAAHRVLVPGKDVFLFALPGCVAELVGLSTQSVPILLLAHFGHLDMVAAYRVVIPAAVMNTAVMSAFTALYTPAASRLYAKGDRAGMADLYVRTAAWITLLSFPIFAATFCFARPVTQFLYGSRYSGSATLMAILACGYYVNAALGFNGLTLRVLGKIRYLILCGVATAAVSVALSLILVPRWQAFGAALATTLTLLIHNALKQGGLALYLDRRIFDRDSLMLYRYVLLTVALLSLTAWILPPSIYTAIVIGATSSVLLIALLKKSLRIAESFPETAKFPVLGRLLA